MRIAVTYENGNIFQHFGHTEQFKLYDIQETQIVKEQIIDASGSGHGALAGFLTENGVDTLICGGIGGGAQMALSEAGIQLYGGVSGSADEAVKALLNTNMAETAPDIPVEQTNTDVRARMPDRVSTDAGSACTLRRIRMRSIPAREG